MADYFTESDDVLENKLGIDNPELLKEAEAKIVFVRLAELSQKPIEGAFDFVHLKAIHEHLFSDIYFIAGKARSVDIAKNGSVFCFAANIEASQHEIFCKLQRNNYLRALDIETFSYKLAELSGDLNALHPFREGNGRVIRSFLIQLANNAGYELQFEDIDKDELLAADIAAFAGNTKLLSSVYRRILSPIQTDNAN